MDEAQLDARAAVAQAKLVGQPSGTAIYFGIDFDLETERSEQVIQYFTIVSNALRDKGYLVGVYGSGAALALLKAERHKTGRIRASRLWTSPGSMLRAATRRRRFLQSRRVGPLSKPDRSLLLTHSGPPDGVPKSQRSGRLISRQCLTERH